MLTREFLERIGFGSDDTEFILSNDRKYADKIAPIAREYMSGRNSEPFVRYEGNGRSMSLQRADQFIQQAHEAVPGVNEYVLNLLAWLNCIPYLYDDYKRLGLGEDIFIEAVKDFSYKAEECRNVHGVCGLFVNWFFLFFELKEFALGRLQYEVYQFDYDEYACGDVRLKKGDRVYSCHIHSGGKLTRELCMESFQKAYEFFKADLSGDIIPIVCASWLLYRPYIDNVFPENSNLMRFVRLFDIIDAKSTGNTFSDGWRVFNKMYEGTTEGLPADNTLRRNYIEYINSGGDFGYGYGIILYDGKEKRIVNRKRDEWEK